MPINCKTQRELRSTLQLEKSMSDEQISEYFKNLIKGYETNQNSNETILIRNLLLVAESLRLKQEYQKLVKQNYQSEMESVDFDAGEAVMNKANEWIKRATNGFIPKFLNKPTNAGIRLIIFSTLYFKANWQKHLKPVKNDKFTLTDGTKKEVQYLSNLFQVNFFKSPLASSPDDEGVVVKMPYINEDLSFTAILPPESVEVNALLKSINLSTLVILATKKGEACEILMPRFHFSNKINMAEPLKAMGLEVIFKKDAEFSSISDEDLYVSLLDHGASIGVSENGTEAAAVTEIELKDTATLDKPKVISFDRPFLFVISDFGKQIPLFVGKVDDPTAK